MHNSYQQHIFPHLFTTTSGSLFHHGTEQTVLLPQPYCGSMQCSVHAEVLCKAMGILSFVVVFIVCSVRKQMIWLENVGKKIKKSLV
jgi:hypothetical protein